MRHPGGRHGCQTEIIGCFTSLCHTSSQDRRWMCLLEQECAHTQASGSLFTKKLALPLQTTTCLFPIYLQQCKEYKTPTANLSARLRYAPTAGPKQGPNSTGMVHTAIARPRSACAKQSDTLPGPSVSGPAPKQPVIKRNAMSIGSCVDRAHAIFPR